MSLIKSVVKDEQERLLSLKKDYDRELSSLPKGASWFKKIKNKHYVYQAYREKGKMVFRYIGNVFSKKGQEFSRIMDRKKHLKNEVQKISTELKDAKRFLKNG